MIATTGIGARIAAERKRIGYSMEEMGEKLNINRRTVENWEKEKTSPGVFDLVRLCELFECDFGYIVGEYGEKTRPVTDIKKETGLSSDAIEVLQALKAHNLDSVLHLISEAITYTLYNPLYSENETILFQALSNTLHLMKLGITSEIGEKGYLWLLQDMFMDFIKDNLKEKQKSAPAFITPRQQRGEKEEL